MASYRIIWKKSAGKELYKISPAEIPKILEAVEMLSRNPHPAGSKKLRNSNNNYRLRCGDYRIIYSVFNNMLIIEIVKVGHRKDVYDRLR